MSQTLDERIDDYLDGFLSSREARAFEAELLDPAVAAALSEALALRTLLEALPPDEPPEGLVERIEAALGLPAGDLARAIEGREARFPRLGAALGGLGWALRGPALAVSPGGSDGFRTVGYVTTPLGIGRAEKAPRPALWRRLVGLGG